MRKLIAIAGAVALAGAMAAPAVATPEDPHKILVCHATSSLKNPYVTIEVDIASTGGWKQFMAHLEHQVNPNKRHGHADVIGPQDGVCPDDIILR